MLKVAEPVQIEKTVTGTAKPKSGDVERNRMLSWLQEHIADAMAAPKTEAVTLTPILAGLLLQLNDANRPISDVNLTRIKRDIVAGRWEFNGDTISISRDGFLNNGQHRCRAVVETGIAIKVIMVFGVSRHSRMTVDQGATRTVGHYFAMQGHGDANVLATVGLYVWQYKEYGYLSSNPERRPTKSEILLAIEHFKDIPDSLRAIPFKGGSVLAVRSIMAFCHWAIAQRAGSVEADAFIGRLMKGNNLSSGDPLLYCRNRLLEMRKDGFGRANDRVELIFKTWNAHRQGRRLDRIVLGNDKLPVLEA